MGELSMLFECGDKTYLNDARRRRSTRERNLLFKSNNKIEVLKGMLEGDEYVKEFIPSAKSWTRTLFADENIKKMLGSNAGEKVWLPYFTSSYPEGWKEMMRILKFSMKIASNDYDDNFFANHCRPTEETVRFW